MKKRKHKIRFHFHTVLENANLSVGTDILLVVSSVRLVGVGTRKHEEAFVSVRCVCYLTYGGGVTGHIRPKLVKLDTLNIYHLLFINYTSIQFFFVKSPRGLKWNWDKFEIQDKVGKHCSSPSNPWFRHMEMTYSRQFLVLKLEHSRNSMHIQTYIFLVLNSQMVTYFIPIYLLCFFHLLYIRVLSISINME